MTMTGETLRTRRDTSPGKTLSATNPTWTALGTNSSLRGEKPTSNQPPVLCHSLNFVFLLEDAPCLFSGCTASLYLKQDRVSVCT
jgi:hypothetical protein